MVFHVGHILPGNRMEILNMLNIMIGMEIITGFTIARVSQNEIFLEWI